MHPYCPGSNLAAYQNYSNAGQGYVQEAFSSDNAGGPKKQTNHTLRPVTIKQLLNAQQTQADGDFRIDNVTLGQVTLIGCIRNVNRQSTQHTFQIEDGTGTIDAKRFPSEDEDPAETSAVDVGTYVRVVGVLKQFGAKFVINTYAIRPIENKDELTYHLLEAIYVHVSSTKSKPSGFSGNMNMNTGMSMSSSGQYNAHGAHHNSGATSGNVMENKILEAIRSHPGHLQGVHRNEIIRLVAPTPADQHVVSELLEQLILDGFLYTGEDESHIMAME
ncbi:replication factor A protein 2 [Podila horticola]|nr:replication factor A protein 2 [Podila horticola]